MTEIYLIRHGEAEGNVFRRFHGQYDALLTPRGLKQVECVAKRFENIHIDACYSSDLTRTSLTARSIYVPKKLKLHRDPRFREACVGVWEDLPFGYLDKYDRQEMWNFNHDPVNWNAPEGAENYEAYTSRFLSGLEDVARRHDGGTIAIFAHGVVIRGTLMRLFFNDVCAKLPYCDNTGVCKLIWDNGTYSYEFINDNSHLPEELSTYAIQRWWRETGDRSEVNFYYIPYETGMELPEGMGLPPMDPNGVTLAAILHERPVALVSMGVAEGDCGRVLGMTIKGGYEGRYYGDQLLGCAFSHFRAQGCTRLALDPGDYPDEIFARYEFDPETRTRSIDTNAFDWGSGE